MRIRVQIAVVLVWLALPIASSAGRANLVEWMTSSSPGSPGAIAVAGGAILAGTDQGLFRFDPAGWTPLLAVGEVLDLVVSEERALVATRAGLFEWGPGERHPRQLVVDGGERIGSLAIDPGGRVWAATQAGLYLRAPGGEDFTRESTLPPGDVTAVRVAGAEIWISQEGALWVRRPGQPFEPVRSGLDAGWWELRGAARLGDRVLLCVPSGLWWVGSKGMEHIDLGIGELHDLEAVGSTVWIASERGLYAYDERELAKGVPPPVVLVPVGAIASIEGGILAVTPSGVAAVTTHPPDEGGRAASERPSAGGSAAVDRMSDLDPPPSPEEIARLHRAVLEHQGLTTGEFVRVSERARLAGWLPELHFTAGVDRDRTREYVRDEVFTSGTFRELFDDERSYGRGLGVGIDLEWDFARLAAPGDAIDISRERRLVIQLRDQVLERVNRLYFERLRVLAALRALGPERTPQHEELELQAAELAARLDGWSGGAFSRLRTDSPR